jgi:Membrane protease subunits, stomatin/prohibitin homologs
MKHVKRTSGILVLIAIIAGIIILCSTVIVTKENQYSVVKRFGKIVDVKSTAGISFKTPFVEDVYFIPKSIQFYDMPASDVITMDKKTMVADSYVLWKVKDPLLFAQSLSSSVTKAEGRIDTTVYNSMKNVIGGLSQADVISGRDGTLNNAFMENIGSVMSQYGIELISVETKHLDLPSDNKTAVFDRMISERDQIAATYTAEGAAQAQKIQNETDKEVAISISNAKADAAKITAEGEAEYMRILSAAYSDESRSDFYTFIRALDAAKASLKGDNKTLILSPDSPIAKIFYKVD